MTLPKIILKSHLYVALGAGIFLAIVGATGSALVFENDIDRALNPKVSYVIPESKFLPLQTLLEKVRAAYPGKPAGILILAQEPGLSYAFALKGGLSVFVNPHTGEILGARSNQELEKGLARNLHLLHTRLLAGGKGEIIVGAASLLTVFLVLTGLVLWWPRRIFTVMRGASWKRTNFDFHNALGLYSSLFLLVVAFTGVMMAFEAITNPLLKRLNASPPPAWPSESTMTPGARPMTLDEIARIAQEALPGAKVTILSVANGGKMVLTAQLKFPEDRTPAGRSRVFIDQYSGKVLLVESTRQAQLGTRIQNLERSLHTGDIFGAPSRALYFLASLILVGQVVTGILIWWKP